MPSHSRFAVTLGAKVVRVNHTRGSGDGRSSSQTFGLGVEAHDASADSFRSTRRRVEPMVGRRAVSIA
jgi:hypothetical protein